MIHYTHLAELKPLVGTRFASSNWFRISQDQINRFAEATGDRQWIHVDVERATAGPYGSTVVHGFLLLSLLPCLYDDAFVIEDTKVRINYGLDRVRFISPVRVDSEVRAHMHLLAYSELPGEGAQLTIEVSFECRGLDRPACIAQTLSRRYVRAATGGDDSQSKHSSAT